MISLFSNTDPKWRIAIIYNDSITLNRPLDGDPLKIYEVNSVSIRSIISSTVEPKPASDGSEAYSARKNSKIIVLDGIIRAPSYEVLFDMIETLGRNFDPALLSFNDTVSHGFETLDFTTLTNTVDGYIDCMYLCRPVGTPDVNWSEYMGTSAPFRLELIAADPRRYLQTSVVSAFGASTAITNPGDYPSSPVISLHMSGAGSAAFTMTNTAYNPDKSLVLNLSGLASGNLVKVYMGEKTIMVGSTRRDDLFVSGQWWDMGPGLQTLTTTNPPTNVTASLEYFPAFSQ